MSKIKTIHVVVSVLFMIGFASAALVAFLKMDDLILAAISFAMVITVPFIMRDAYEESDDSNKVDREDNW